MTHDVAQAVQQAWLSAFLLTLAIEVPLFVLLSRREKEDRRPPLWRAAIGGAAGTCATHPALWFLWLHVVSDYTAYIASGELLVAAVETVTFFAIARPISFRLALAASFVANAASYSLGALLH